MRGILILLISVSMVMLALPVASQQAIHFGFPPFLSVNSLERSAGPLVKALGEHLQQPVEFKTRKSFAGYLQALNDQRFDIALIQPFDYVRIRGDGFYQPLVRKQGYLQGRIITKDPDIQALDDLRGQTIAFPGEGSAVTLLSNYYLKHSGFSATDFEPRIFNDHASCLLSVINGTTKACAGTAESMARAPSSLQLRAFSFSQQTPRILIVIGPRLATQIDNLEKWFLSLNNTPDGRALLKNAFLNRVDQVADQEYDLVEKIYREVIEMPEYFSSTIKQ